MKNLVALLFILFLISCNTQAQVQVEYGSNPKVGKYIDVNDIKVYYEVYGEGEPLLLLHGNGGSIENFIYQIPELSKYFKVIAIDSRAQGRSSDSDQEISYSLMASDMSQLIDKLNLGKVNVFGWSDGGCTALEVAYTYPEKVLKVIICGANYSHESFLAPPENVTMNPNDPLIVQTSPMLKRYSTISKERSPIIKEKLKVLMENYPNFTLEQLKTISVPIMIVVGDHDIINIDHTITFFKNLPKAQLFVIPRASHFAPIEYPELINKEITRFLKTPYRDIDLYYFMK